MTSSPTSPLLSLAGITCAFADGEQIVTALDDVTLDVDRGRMVAVMGPSGSGKSTLLHVACGLVEPSGGTVRIDGRPPPRAGRGEARLAGGVVRRDARRWWARQRRDAVGVVHQRLNLMPALPVLDNVALPLRLAGTSRAAARWAARLALAEVAADDLAATAVDRLSTGQQQRVALARAIVGDRQLILADEPTAALDTVAAEQLTELLGRLAAAGRAVLMVTHDSRLASWADEVVVLRDGRVVDHVTPTADPTPSGAGTSAADTEVPVP